MKLTLSLVVFIFLMGSVFAYTSFSGAPSSYSSVVRPDLQNYYSGGQLQQYWPILTDPEQCVNRQDILIQVSPGGCQPAVVRSDLLAEQNVPVFCQLDALTFNPLIDIKSIDSISFSGSYPEEIVGSGFHPARAALRTHDRLLGDPIINNIGYLVVVMKKQSDERQLPDEVNVTLQARIHYNADNAFGVGRAEFLLEEQSDDEWAATRNKQSFWQGKFFVRLEDADANTATVSFYQGERKVSSIRVNRGETSRDFYLPGLYCQAGLKVAYDGFIPAETSAVVQIDDEVFEVTKGMKILENQCTVAAVGKEAQQDVMRLTCAGKSYTLTLSQRLFERGDVVQLVADASVNWTVIDSYPAARGSTSVRYSINKTLDRQITAEQLNVSGEEIRLLSSERLVDRQYEDQIEREFKKSIDFYQDVADSYAAERDSALSSSYGEIALTESFGMALRLGKERTASTIAQQLLEEYPDAPDRASYESALTSLYSVDSSRASAALFVNGETRVISLIEVNEPAQKPSAFFVWQGTSDRIPVALRNSTPTEFGTITLESLTVDSVQGRVACANGSITRFSLGSDARVQNQGGSQEVCGGRVLILDEIFVGEQARVRILPSVKNLETETNVSVVVGVEKRALELTPDKTKERLEELNKTIKQWESISNNLGNAVKGLKTACFATAGVLTVKNFLSGLSGEGIARQKVMRERWNVECARLVSAREYANVGECYYQKSNDINRDVATTQRLLEAENTRIRDIESQYSESVEGVGSVFGETIVDRNKSANDFARQELLGSYGETSINGQRVSDLVNASGGYDRGEFTYDQARDMKLNLDIVHSADASPGLKVAANESLKRIARSITESTDLGRSLEASRKDESSGLPGLYGEPLSANDGPIKYVSVGTTEELRDSGLKSQFAVTSTHVARVPIKGSVRTLEGGSLTAFAGGTYVIGLRKERDNYLPEKVLFFNASDSMYYAVSDQDLFLDTYGLGAVRSLDQVSYNNKYLNPRVRYYETEPVQPAIVPFDTQRGWYAATKQILPAFGGIGAFDSSGRPTSVWICNVGENGQEQFFESLGDDVCQQVNLNTGQPLDLFPGLTETQAQAVINRGVEAVQEAARQYANGKRVIQVRGLSGTETLPVGDPAANIPATQCQNYMSPEECRLLFNVCDPVICPSSRCDFGGAYPVADVIQTGIVGSALLCLPNFREGIYVPVCLTGIKAGIDGYVSILKSHQLCLEENLESGKYVGICDEITAVYACEFFWRQAAPLANVLLPKLVEVASGQTAPRGGGEYLTTQAAWQHAQDSVNYFTQTYAVNSLEAFKIRSVEEAGSTFCKAFISAKGPKTFEALVEPDSPAQFHAWFSSTPYTSATVPATSQYKTFYHIFAGNDQGVSYTIYLKDPPQTSYYQTTQFITVATGFVPKGQFATETKDFTAPQGYQQLCVRINNREECGFTEVSTSFAVNQLRDSFAQEELTRTGITSEQTCVSGGGNVGALIQPNLQAGVEETLYGETYDRGIVRICATRNPGSESDPARFIDVGYCSDTGVRCWLDKKSVDNALTNNNIGARNATLLELQEIQKNTLADQGVIYRDDVAKTKIDELIDARERLRESMTLQDAQALVNQIDVEFDKIFLNHQRARLVLLKAQVYADLVEHLLVNTVQQSQAVAPGASSTSDEGIFFDGDEQVVDGEQATVDLGTELRLAREYDPAQEIFVYQGETRTSVYVNNNRVFLSVPFSFGFGVAPGSFGRDKELGTVNGDAIRLLPSARDLIPDLYLRLNGATLDGVTILSSQGSEAPSMVAPVTPTLFVLISYQNPQTRVYLYHDVLYNGIHARFFIREGADAREKGAAAQVLLHSDYNLFYPDSSAGGNAVVLGSVNAGVVDVSTYIGGAHRELSPNDLNTLRFLQELNGKNIRDFDEQ